MKKPTNKKLLFIFSCLNCSNAFYKNKLNWIDFPFFYHFVLFLLCVTWVFSSQANNISANNNTLTGKNTTSDYILVQFDLSWENSWRTSSGPSNWDAAWVFVKYRILTQSSWQHATLNWVDGTGSGDGHTEPANTNIYSTNDNGSGGAYGAFIHRNADMAQANVSYAGVQLRWNYGVDGVADNDDVEICVFAIEMVFCPQSNFYAGDGTSTNITGQFESGTSGSPLQITSEGALTLGGGGAGSLGNNNASGMSSADDFNDITSQTLPAAFPKGYAAFYCMKYEISQQQYVDFLNKLSAAQATPRAYTGGGSRHAITGSPGSYSTTNPYLACNFISWRDLTAYLDWSALRPMTELEFEKACRGTQPALADEYVWRSTNIATSIYTLNNSGLTNEGIATNYSTTSGNAFYRITSNEGNTITGPVRVGIFAANASNTGRETAGATYYGAMEMGGNVQDRSVTVGNTNGRNFTGLHGDGEIDASGDANVSYWPGTNASGSNSRGGYWKWSNATDLRVSDRTWGTSTDSNRDYYTGGRGIRTAL